MDIGWDHPTACAHIAIDRDSDTVYVYDGYRESRALPLVHAESVKKHGDWIPTSWPHDGMKADPQSGKIIADIYRDHGINMWPVPFTNPPPPGIEEGKGGMGVEAGIFQMLELMETNRFKVFKNIKYWWEESVSLFLNSFLMCSSTNCQSLSVMVLFLTPGIKSSDTLITADIYELQFVKPCGIYCLRCRVTFVWACLRNITP